MKLSGKKRTELYNAISETIMTYRIERSLLERGKIRKSTIVSEDIDSDMYYLMNRIWAEVKKVFPEAADGK